MFRKLTALAFGLLAFNLLFFPFQADYTPQLTIFTPGTVWFFLCILLAQVFTLILFYTPFPNRLLKKQQFASWASALAVILSFLALWRANPIDQMLFGLASILLTGLAFYLFSLTHQEFGALSEVLTVFPYLISGWFEGGGRLVKDLLNIKLDTKKFSLAKEGLPKVALSSTAQMGIFRGVFIAVPVIFILLGLLTTADPIFAQSLANIFRFDWQWLALPVWLGPRLILSTMFLVFIAPFAWLMTNRRYLSPFQQIEFKNLQIEAIILSASVAILLAFFLLIQFRYIFVTVSETQLHQFGVQTYSEYVKKGFSELLLVSLIVYAVAGFSMIVYRISQKRQSLLRNINVLLLSETLVFIFSIMRRLYLYAQYHGLSRVRVYGMLFLLGIFFFTITLILRHFQQWRMRWYLVELGSIVLVMLLGFTLNVDRLIASKYLPTVNGQVDYGYLSRLSSDGSVGWLSAYQHARSVILNPSFLNRTTFMPDEARQITYAYDVTSNLLEQRQFLSNRYQGVTFAMADLLTPHIKAYNFADAAAYQNLKAEIFGSELDLLHARAGTFMAHILDSQQSVPLDRSSQSPLVR